MLFLSLSFADRKRSIPKKAKRQPNQTANKQTKIKSIVLFFRVPLMNMHLQAAELEARFSALRTVSGVWVVVLYCR
jgi:hypothetical protein